MMGFYPMERWLIDSDVDPFPAQMYFYFFQGSEIFAAKINIEVQRASEGAIAAIERNGGVITTSFYDPISLGKLTNNYNATNLMLYSVCL